MEREEAALRDSGERRCDSSGGVISAAPQPQRDTAAMAAAEEGDLEEEATALLDKEIDHLYAHRRTSCECAI